MSFGSNATRKLLAMAVIGLAAPAWGVTTQTFDGGGTPFIGTSNNAGAVPVILPGGPTGNFLQVMPDGVGGLQNGVGFNQTSLGAVSSISFDVRMPIEATHTGCCGQRADGFGVSILNTNQYGTSGAAPTISERPNPTNALSVGFDIFEGNASSPNFYTLNRDGVQVAGVAVDLATLNLNTGLFNRVDITFTPTATGSMATVTVTPDALGTPGAPVVLFNNVNLEGYSAGGRLAFGGRTGGAVTSLDLDNVNASYTMAKSTQVDFDSVGSGYTLSPQGGLPNPQVQAGGPTGNFLRLLNDTGSQTGNIALNATEESVNPSGLVISSFDFRITDGPGGGRADGFSMLLIPTATFGGAGNGVSGFTAEEPNIAGIIAVGFDVFPNQNDASLHFGSELVNIDLNPGAINLSAGVFHNAQFTLLEEGGQVLASLVLTPDVHGAAGAAVTAFSNVVIPGLTDIYSYRLQFTGRTGGEVLILDLDNISVTNVIPEPASALLGLMGLGALAARRRRCA